MKKATISCVLAIFLFFSLSGVALSQETKKVEAKVGWIRDQNKLFLMKGGEEPLMDLVIDPEKVKVEVFEFIHQPVKRGDITDVRSGRKVKIDYIEKDGKKIAQKISVTVTTKVKAKKKKK